MLFQHDLPKGLIHRVRHNIQRKALNSANEFKVLLDCQLVKKHIELLTKAKILLHLVHLVRDTIPVDCGFAATWLVDTSKHVKRSRLTSSIVPEYRVHLTLPY
jgi:hypothetical protein